MKKHVAKQSKQIPVTVRLPNSLHEQLQLKSQSMGDIGTSETIRVLLNSSLENYQLDNHFKYTMLIHSLLQEALLSLVENGDGLIKRAEIKAEKILASIVEQ